MDEIKRLLTDAILTRTDDGDIIEVTLADGQVAEYTKDMLPIMLGDPMVKRIVDKCEGEILYIA